MINSSPTRNFGKGKEFSCMTQDSISFWEAQVKVDRSVHYSPSIQWISSQAIHGAIQTRKGGNQPH
ncbi:hypothetical protein AAG906_004501 [Vitis piasezkii]